MKFNLNVVSILVSIRQKELISIHGVVYRIDNRPTQESPVVQPDWVDPANQRVRFVEMWFEALSEPLKGVYLGKVETITKVEVACPQTGSPFSIGMGYKILVEGAEFAPLWQKGLTRKRARKNGELLYQIADPRLLKTIPPTPKTIVQPKNEVIKPITRVQYAAARD